MCAVCSIPVEVWCLTGKVVRAINGTNSRMVSTISSRSIKKEVTEGKTYNMVSGIKETRLR